MKTYKANCPELKVQLKRDQIKKVKIKSSNDSADFFRGIWDDSIDIYESFFCIYLNNANNTIGWYKVSQGGITGTVADPRLIIKKALDVLATSIIMCHNHPSGQLIPSNADINITQKIKKAGEFLDIAVLDHIILTEDSYYSFADNDNI
jgi:DNA repair protein RadC